MPTRSYLARLVAQPPPGSWVHLRRVAPARLPPLLHCSYKQGMTNGANHVTRAMVQWCVAVHTTFRLVSWLRGVLWRARWSWTWTWTWVASNVGDEVNFDLLLPLLVWVGFSFFFLLFFWLWLWLWLSFGPHHMPWVVVFSFFFFF